MALKRPCEKCDKYFQPTGKFQRLCDSCRNDCNKEKLTISYFKNKEELDTLRDNITLKKWKILSKAYKQGKRIWGSKFTRERLSIDMDIPYTTTLRCLALDKANKKSWKLVREGKLSVFKLAMVCQLKSITYQDEIINMVVSDSLSTYQIKTLKINNLKDVKLEKLRLSCENGYSRKDSAYTNFLHWTNRGKLFLMMDKKHLPDNKLNEIKIRLKKLNKDISEYLK